MLHVQECPGCGHVCEVELDDYPEGIALDVTQLDDGRYKVTALYVRRNIFGLRTHGFSVIHECGRDDGDGDPVPAWPPDCPPSRVLSAERDPDDD